MANNITYKLKRGTDAALTRVNPILAAGEPIVVFHTDGRIQLKIGDGKTPYTELALSTYIADDVSISFNDDKISLAGFDTAKGLTVPFKVTDGLMEWVSLDFVSSNNSLKYNANTGEIELCTVSGEVISKLDAAEFAVAGLIEDVAYDAGNNTLIFIWNTNGGIKTSTIPLNNMLSPYTEGNGISLDNNEISVKISPSSENYLFISESGIGIRGISEAFDMFAVQQSSNINNLKSELSGIDNQLRADYNAINATVSTINSQVSAVEQELTAVKSSIDTRLSDKFNNFKDEIAVDINGLESGYNSLASRLDQVESDIANITDITDIDATINTAINATVPGLIETALTDINKNLPETMDNLATLQEDFDALVDTGIQDIVDFALLDYVKSDDISSAIEDAAKDLNINLDKIDGGRITDVASS